METRNDFRLGLALSGGGFRSALFHVVVLARLAELDLLHHLEVGSRQMFKVFFLKRTMPYLVLLPLPVLITLLTLFLIFKILPMVFWFLLICFALVLIYTQNVKILQLMDNAAVLKKIKLRILKALLFLRLPEPLSYIMALTS